MSVYVFRVQSATWCAYSFPRGLPLGSLGQFARWSGSSLRSGDLGGPPSLLARGGSRRAARRVADRLRRVRAHRLDVGDVEVGGVAPSPTAPSAASFAARAAGVSPHLSERLVSRFQHGGADQGPLFARLKAFA